MTEHDPHNAMIWYHCLPGREERPSQFRDVLPGYGEDISRGPAVHISDDSFVQRMMPPFDLVEDLSRIAHVIWSINELKVFLWNQLPFIDHGATVDKGAVC